MKKRKDKDAVVVELEDGDLPPAAYTHRLKPGKATKAYGSEVEVQIDEGAIEILGDHGRLLGSKTAYDEAHAGDLVYFNACIFDGHKLRPRGRRRAKLLWYGDLNLTLETAKLQEVADRIGPIVVTPEQPYRFDGLPKRPRKVERIAGIYIFRPG